MTPSAPKNYGMTPSAPTLRSPPFGVPYDLRRAQLEKEAELRKRIDPIPLAAVAENQATYKA